MLGFGGQVDAEQFLVGIEDAQLRGAYVSAITRGPSHTRRRASAESVPPGA
jgi:hypothetical protein